MSRILSCFVLLLSTVACSAQTAVVRPRNIILVIGDGMGPAHFTVARYDRAEKFQIGTMPVTGFATVHCADRTITDSAAAASALATGQKVKYEAMAMDAEGKPIQTVLELAELRGKETGVVTTAAFYDATPGAFMAHVAVRREYAPIVEQIMKSGADVVIGAGLGSFGKNGLPAIGDVAASGGYFLADSLSSLARAPKGKVLGVFPSQPREVDNPDAKLPQLAAWAIERLSSAPNGFFLMIEHEGTDGASHQNNLTDMRASASSLDEAVGVALAFARSRTDTLVIVTGDHETGGLRITETRQLGRVRPEWSDADHTSTAVPVFAYGPGSQQFSGFYDNTDIGKRLKAFVE